MLKSFLKTHIKTKHDLKFVLWDILNTLNVSYIYFTVKSAITKQSQILILITMSVQLIRPRVSHHLDHFPSYAFKACDSSYSSCEQMFCRKEQRD